MPGLQADVQAVRGAFSVSVPLEIPAGGVVSLLGPNGSGKTTVVEVLAGLLPMSGGHLRVDGRLIEDPATGLRLPPGQRGVGLVFQDLRLLPWLSVLDNVAYGPRASGDSRAVARQTALQWLDRLGARPLAAKAPGALSGGEAQCVALARALAARPRLLLLDEPLSALDVRARGQLRTQLRTVLAGYDGMCLLITHEPLEAFALADRIVVLEAGGVAQTGTPDEIRSRPRSPFVAALTGLNLLRGRLQRTAGGEVSVTGPQGTLAVADPGQLTAAEVVATFPPHAVTLLPAPVPASARNQIPSTVMAVDVVGGRARVRLAGRPPMVAEVTTGAVADLGLAPGEQVWAAVKATEIAVEPG